MVNYGKYGYVSNILQGGEERLWFVRKWGLVAQGMSTHIFARGATEQWVGLVG